MKRVFTLIVGLVLLFCLSCSRNNNEHGFYGTYTFEEVSYLSLLSSSTIDYMNERMAGTEYTIEADLFKIEASDNTVEINSPNYIKEEIKDSIPAAFDAYTAISEDVKYQYTVYKKDGTKTNWRVYASSDTVWIGSYVDNTANGSEIIMYIYKLSK